MKLVRYGERGAEKPGAIDENGVLRDLSDVVPDIAGEVLTDLDRLAALDLASLPEVAGNPRLGACVGGTGKFMCIGLNYSDHAAERVVSRKWWKLISGTSERVELCAGQAAWSRVASATG